MQRLSLRVGLCLILSSMGRLLLAGLVLSQ
jgi:hypothetical protein